MPGPQFLDWRTFARLDLDKIEATAQSWCANTVRLQLNQDNLISPDGTGLNRSYLTAIETEVAAADPQVIFDLFNEPRMYSPGMTMAQVWRLWHDGGVFRGVSASWDAGFGYLVTTGAAPVVSGE